MRSVFCSNEENPNETRTRTRLLRFGLRRINSSGENGPVNSTTKRCSPTSCGVEFWPACDVSYDLVCDDLCRTFWFPLGWTSDNGAWMDEMAAHRRLDNRQHQDEIKPRSNLHRPPAVQPAIEVHSSRRCFNVKLRPKPSKTHRPIETVCWPRSFSAMNRKAR